MTAQSAYIIAAVVLIGALPLVPKMMALRTRALYALRLRSLAAWHERNTGALIVVVRVIMTAVAVLLVILTCGRQW